MIPLQEGAQVQAGAQEGFDPIARSGCGQSGEGLLEVVLCHATQSWPWSGIAGFLLVGGCVGGFLLWRRHRERQARLPLLVFPTTGGPPLARVSPPPAPSPTPSADAAEAKPLEDRRVTDQGAPAGKERRKRSRDRRRKRRGKGTHAPSPSATPSAPPPPAPGVKEAPPPEPVSSPGPDPSPGVAPPPPHAEVDPFAEGTLQLLPGWLERKAGEAPSDEIRFVRVPGAPPEVTFGRQPGPEFRHVQLRSPAVSRLHARLILVEEGWTIRNESGTNPTLLNGKVLDSASGDILLVEGDRIEMGDVVFVFHGARGRDALSARSGWHTDQGPRPTNQDAVLVRKLTDSRELAVVCDGMGSHTAGGRASHAAMEAFVAELEGGGELEDAVHAAQEAVRRVATAESDPDGVGTTLVALLRDGGAYRVVNVGDSRAYRLLREGLVRITRDHSFVEEAVASGRMSAEEARRSPLRNAVTRSLGETPAAEADFFGPYEIERGERVLLSSDGLHGVLDDGTIARLLGEDLPVPDLPRRLVRAALEAGTRDNVSVATLSFH